MAWSFSRRGGYRQHTAEVHRSGFEDKAIAPLDAAKVPYEYEKYSITFVPALRKYTPDVVLPNGIIIELKGLFLSEDRSKHKWIKKQYPHLEIRFVFQNAATKVEGGTATNAEWCKKNGFMYASRFIPDEWIRDKTKYDTTGLEPKKGKKK